MITKNNGNEIIIEAATTGVKIRLLTATTCNV